MLCHFRERVQPGMNEMNCSAALKERVCDISPLQNFLLIAVKLNECYCMAYLYASNATIEKGADPLSGEPVIFPEIRLSEPPN